MIPVERSRATNLLFWAGFLFILVIGIKMTAYVFIIVVVSLILTLLAWPSMKRMRKKGVPDLLAVSLLTILAMAAVLLLLLLTVYSFGFLLQQVPLYQAEFNERIAEISNLLAGYDFPAEFVPPSTDLATLLDRVLSSLLTLSDIVLYLFFIAVTTFFMLLEAPHIKGRLRRLPLMDEEKLSRFASLSQYMIDFVVVRTETNLVHGVLFGSVLYLMGVPAPLLWGVLIFVLSFIPYIGLIVAGIPPIFLAWLQFGVWGAVAVLVLLIGLNLIVENPVFSYFAARTFEIPPLIVILSLIFWGWLLGIAGMVFCIPLTLIVLIFIQASDELSWINVLLGVDHIFDNEKKNPGPGVIAEK
ncbi:MAG: AI-2E family transporter [Methanomicrobiaceae archaeon]|nr:AI-2E family transporter [Methanomicrobiaceae archaeon]